MAGPVLVGSIDGQPHLHDVVRRGAQLAALLATDLIVGLCDLDSFDTRVSTSEEELLLTSNSLPKGRVHIARGASDDVVSWIASLIGKYHPAWICASKDCLGAEHLLQLSAVKRLIENCCEPIWLVSKAAERRPIVLAAIDPAQEHNKPVRLDLSILEHAAQLADLLQAQLHVLHAAFAFDVSRSILEEMQERRRGIVEELVQTYEVPADRVHVPIGLAGMQIERLAEEMRPEAVVMGAVKRGALRQITMGSTAREVVEKLPCDLVAIRSGG